MTLFHRILVPLDFSPVSAVVMRCATELARRYDAELHLLHVRPAEDAELPDHPPHFGGDLFDDARARAELALSAIASEARGWGARVERVTVGYGVAATEILGHVRDQHCDLVVMGTHGRTGLARLFMGSVAEAVVRRAPCAVLTIPGARAATEPDPGPLSSDPTPGPG